MKKEVDTLLLLISSFSVVLLGFSNVVCYQITVQVKAKLYSNFVKSGTLTGGKMEEVQETDSGFVEDKVNLNWRLCRFLFEGCDCIISLECSNPFCLKQVRYSNLRTFPSYER